MKDFSKNKKAARALTDVLSVSAGAFLSSFALFSFINPNGFVGGGVGGIATILEAAGILKSYIVLLALNVPLLICALIKLKKGFAVKTVSVTLMTSGIMALMDKFNFLFSPTTVCLPPYTRGFFTGLRRVFFTRRTARRAAPKSLHDWLNESIPPLISR
jgi:Uncharacterized conserved protein